MNKPNRHLWKEGSTHRAVAGKEYDEVWDYVDQLEAENVALKGEIAEAMRMLSQYYKHSGTGTMDEVRIQKEVRKILEHEKGDGDVNRT